MKLKKISSLVMVALASSALFGCNSSGSGSGEGGGDDGGNGGGDSNYADHVATSLSDLVDKISQAQDGDVIALSYQDFSLAAAAGYVSGTTITLDKSLTLTSSNADGLISNPGENQAVLMGTVCIDVPSSADGVEDIRISNLKFTHIETASCGAQDNSHAIINIGKVGSGDAPVTLDNLLFDGSNFIETADSEHAWIYSYGLVEIRNSQFINKQTNAAAANMVYLDCASDTINGGSERLSSSVIDGNLFNLDADSDQVSGVTVGQFDGKHCAPKITNNQFEGFVTDKTDQPDTIAAIVDGGTDDESYPSATVIEGNTFDNEWVEPPVDELTPVEALNIAIADATEGDVIDLEAGADYSEGVIELNKAVTLDGHNSVSISGNACIKVTAPGAKIQNLTFDNDFLGFNDTIENSCALGTSDGQAGAISIDKIGKGAEPVILNNLRFDAVNIQSQADVGDKKASWVFSYGYFNLIDSEFVNLKSNMQNNGVHINCSNTDDARVGSVIEGNRFEISLGGSSETAAIKVGDSSGNKIKEGNKNEECNVTIKDNTFAGYNTLLTADLSSEGDARPAGMFAHSSALNDDAETSNVLE